MNKPLVWGAFLWPTLAYFSAALVLAGFSLWLHQWPQAAIFRGPLLFSWATFLPVIGFASGVLHGALAPLPPEPKTVNEDCFLQWSLFFALIWALLAGVLVFGGAAELPFGTQIFLWLLALSFVESLHGVCSHAGCKRGVKLQREGFFEFFAGQKTPWETRDE